MTKGIEHAHGNDNSKTETLLEKVTARVNVENFMANKEHYHNNCLLHTRKYRKKQNNYLQMLYRSEET